MSFNVRTECIALTLTNLWLEVCVSAKRAPSIPKCASEARTQTSSQRLVSVSAVRRACAYVERRSGLLDVAYRRANLRYELLTFWHEPLTFDVLDRSTFWTATPDK